MFRSCPKSPNMKIYLATKYLQCRNKFQGCLFDILPVLDQLWILKIPHTPPVRAAFPSLSATRITSGSWGNSVSPILTKILPQDCQNHSCNHSSFCRNLENRQNGFAVPSTNSKRESYIRWKSKYAVMCMNVSYGPSSTCCGEVAKHVEGFHVVRLDFIDSRDVEALHLDLVAVRRVPLRSIHTTWSDIQIYAKIIYSSKSQHKSKSNIGQSNYLLNYTQTIINQYTWMLDTCLF